MWGGYYVCDHLEKYSRDEDLHGLSTYLENGYFKRNDGNQKIKEQLEKVKLIESYRKMWKHIDVWEEAVNYVANRR
jgi:uncharacterized membrane protein